MNIIEKIKKNALAMSLALATVIGFSAFKVNETYLNKGNTIEAQDELHWYVRDNQGNYSEFTPSSPGETVDDICPDSGPQICALGFESEMNPNELSDADAPSATAQLNKPLDP